MNMILFLLGGYLYLSAGQDITARLLSNRITTAGGADKCVEFFYHMYGPDVTSLKVVQHQTNVVFSVPVRKVSI